MRRRPKKLFHGQVVTLEQFGVLCQNGCGLYYIPPDPKNPKKPLFSEKTGDDTRCPTCQHHPRPEKISTEPELVEFVVKIAMGNVSMEFVRAVGPAKITRVPLVLQPNASPAESRALVTSPSEGR